MAADEDNFDIDVYGDGEGEPGADHTVEDDKAEDGNAVEILDYTDNATHEASGDASKPEPTKSDAHQSIKLGNGVTDEGESSHQQIASSVGTRPDQVDIPKQPPQQQGTKRKEGPDDRPTDSGATTAIFISDLQWWSTDDDIRGWVNQSKCEDELKDITFSEHKVNGKSKGQAFVEFNSPQAATAVKRKIESHGDGQPHAKKYTVTYTSAASNPYRTLPKDTLVRGKDSQRTHENRSASGTFNNSGGITGAATQATMSMPNSSYRAGRGGYNRTLPMNHMQGIQHRNFSGPMGGGLPAGFPGQQMAGYANAQMGGLAQFGGFQNRGAMMGGMRGGPMVNRGGRGAMGPAGMMGGMPSMGGIGGMGGMGGMSGMMGAMPGQMGGMAGAMGMGPMTMQGQGGFQGPQPHFNPAFFGQGQGAAGDGSWNPHGTKRQRPE